MLTADHLEKLERLDELIRLKSTGAPSQLAERLDISKRTVYEYLNILRELGARIRYDHLRCTYQYEESGRFNFRFTNTNEISHS